ncbi:MAG: hypothetical protein WCJ37_07125 [Syntrophus sp. (in: bacteria)]
MQVCFNCRQGIEIAGKIGRREVCSGCGKDLHVCRNCRFYDPQIYNACHELQAERVIDKDRGNFCEYFSFWETVPETDRPAAEPAAKEKLATLFK